MTQISRLIQNLKRALSKCSSLLLLFQRSPVVQMFFPQANLLASSTALNTTGFAIASIVGLGAYDSVAGATVVVQAAPSPGSSIIPVTAGTNLAGLFQITGNYQSPPESWSVSSGTLPAGLTLAKNDSTTATLTGTTTQIGSRSVTIRAWEFAGNSGEFAEGKFTIVVSAPPGAAISTHPASITINSGTTATLTVTATGNPPLNYQWYQGVSGVTTSLVGTNSNVFTTPALTATTSYWVKVTNTVNPTGANSNTATVTVRQPAAIVTQPAPVTINSGQSTTLSVVASGDEPLTYQWYQGASGVTTNPISGATSASFTTPMLSVTTSYWVKVTNAANLTGANSSAATVTVRQPAAIVTAPISATIDRGQSIQLSVVASGDAPLTYHWYEGASGVTTNSVGSDSATFTSPPLAMTTSFWVKVTNAANLAGADSSAAVVTVRQPAAITAHPVSVSINSGQTTTLSVTATGDAPLAYKWYEGESGVTTTPVGTNSPSFTTPPLTDTTRYWVKVTNAANSIGANSTAAVVTVQKPAAITIPPAPVTINAGERATLSVSAIGLGPLSYQWYEGPSGLTANPVGMDSDSFTTPDLTATTSYWVKVTNSLNPTGANSVAAKVTVLPVTPATAHAMSQSTGLITPATRGSPGATWFGWQTFNEPGARSQPIDDNTPDLGPPEAGARFQTANGEDHVLNTGAFSFANGSLSEQITVPTAGSVGSAGFTTLLLQISAPAGSGAFPGTMTLAAINGVVPQVVQGINQAGDGQLWAKWELPGNEASYVIGLTGPPGQGGFAFEKVVIDTLYSLTGYMPDTMAAMPPEIETASPLPLGIVGMPYSRQLAGVGGHAPYEFVLSAGPLPEGLSLSPEGLLSGTPTAAASGMISVFISDADLLHSTKSFSLTVSTLPVISTPASLPPGHIGGAYFYNLAAGGGTAPYTWAVTSGALPAWLKVSAAGLVSGTPPDAGITDFSVELTDANGLTDTRSFSLTITTNPVILTASPLPVGRVGLLYNMALGAEGGVAPYTWTVGSGALPAGFELSDTGILSGTAATASNTSFTAQVSDANGVTATKNFSLSITTSPVIANSTLPSGHTLAPYSVALAASGGTAPYQWTMSEGSLPAGLSLTSGGLLSGTPTTAGGNAFTLQVADANGFTHAKACSVFISDLTITTSSLPTAVKGVPFSYSFNGTGGAKSYTWTIISGAAPEGITLGSTTGVLSGTTTASGDFAFTVQLKDAGGVTISKAFTLPVSATLLKPVVQPIDFSPVNIGADFSYAVTALNYPKSFAITGLPAGLKFVAATGNISGRPDVSGVFNVQVRATNAAGASPMVTARLIVKPLDKYLVGVFGGLVVRNATANHGLGGSLSLTTTSNGSYSLKLIGALPASGAGAASTAYSATGRLAATAPHITIPLGGQTLTLTLHAADGQVTGTLGPAAVNGWRSFWDAAAHPASTLQGYYSMALNLVDARDLASAFVPHGTGFATLSIGLSGSVVTAGKTADGETITGASFLGPNGEFGIYTPLYKNQGTIQGQITLTEDPAKLFAGNTLSGAPTWSKPAIAAARAYPDAFGPVPLSAEGGYLASTGKGNAILGLPEAGGVQLDFNAGGVDQSATQPALNINYTADNKVVLPPTAENPAKVSLTINAATGAVSGNFTLVETNPPLTRSKVPFQGQIVRLANSSIKAVGYFMLPQIPAAGQSAATAPILSGAFSLHASGVSQGLAHSSSVVQVAPVIDPIALAPITVGADFSYTVAAANAPKTFAITGLPAGLKFTAATGLISGRADVSGVFNIQIRASNASGSSSTVTTQLTVKALDSNLVGTFCGLVPRDATVNGGLGGAFIITTTANGSYSVKLTSALPGSGAKAASASFSASGRLAASAPQISVSLGGQPFKITFDPATGQVAGSLGTVIVSGWRAFWNALNNPADLLQGYYSFALDLADALDLNRVSVPHGSGFAAGTATTAGAFAIAGKTADGESITCSTFLGADGELALYMPLYKNLGSLQGQLTLSQDPQSLFVGNQINGALTWFKPITATKSYSDTFGPTNLAVAGGYLSPTNKSNAIVGLPQPGAAQLLFTQGGISGSVTKPDITFTFTDDAKVVLPATALNPGKVSLTISPATGAVAGTFTLVETSPPLTRSKVPFQAQIVRTPNGSLKAAGYFMLPQLPDPGQSPAAAPSFSGRIVIQQSP